MVEIDIGKSQLYLGSMILLKKSLLKWASRQGIGCFPDPFNVIKIATSPGRGVAAEGN